MGLPLLPTSLVGSYSQPDWLIDRARLAGRFPPRTRAMELWRVDPEHLEQAWDDATVIAIREQEELFGKERTYCHCFFGLKDGSALAFFQFANADDDAEFNQPVPPSPFRHVALYVDKDTQDELEGRIKAAGLEATYVLEHGYCRSVYAVDPDGMIVEFTHDAPHADQINEVRRKDAHRELKRWLAGDHSPNNDVRPSELEKAG